jgi:hypothetical protein
MVMQDGGAHLRISGAEDLLAWTDAQVEEAADGALERPGVKDALKVKRVLDTAFR